MTRSNDSQKIIVVGIPKTYDDAHLSELFGEFGAVVEAKVVMDATTNVSRGFGFVTFTAASAMRSAIKGINRKVIDGRTLNVRQLVPKDEFQSQKKETEDVSQRPCWLLRKGKCTKGANCPFSHDIKDGEYGNCFEYVQTGECKRGDKCKFSHPEPELGEDGEVKENLHKTVEKKDAKPEKRVCYSYQNGRCHRGKNCLFVHELLVTETETKDTKKGKEEKKSVKEPFEVVTKTDAGKKRRRPDDESESEKEEEEMEKSEKTYQQPQKKTATATGQAAHVNSFKSSQKPTQQKQQNPQSGPKKFEWKAKVVANNTAKQVVQHEEPKHQVQRATRQEIDYSDRNWEARERPVKKVKTERVDMGAAFDGVSDDDTRPRQGKFKRKVDKETMRANREKMTLERRAKRSAKKTALSNLQTKAQVELEA